MMGLTDYIRFSLDTTIIDYQLLSWSDIEYKTNHRDTWPQTPNFRRHVKNVPALKIVTNILRGHRFKIGSSKK